ncbi:MAG: M20 family metallopeptidase [Melioribacteraceae bacterium]|nr:M20 family metallopeptidase [Melioribacteraceae bacterium]
MKYNGNNVLSEIVEIVEQLVSFKTTPSNYSEFEGAISYIENYFADTVIKIDKHYFNKFPALFISTTGLKHASVLLQGHVDVVDGNESQFTPIVKNGKLYGRGAADMKGFVAIAMKLLLDFEKHSSECNVALVLTFDEEIGSENGAKKMAELGYTGDLIINGDAGYNHSVIHGEKGILKIKLKVEATPGRHPYTWQGKNAFELLNEDYNSIISLFTNKEIATEEDNWYTTYSIYDIKCENREQYPPHYTEAKMNFYFTEDLTVADILNLIKSKVKHCEVEQFIGSERVFLDPKSKYIQQLHKIMSAHFDRDISIRTENGSSDARFYTNKNIPIVILKPVGEDHHGDNEYLDVDSLLPLYNTLKEFILEYNENKLEVSISEGVNAK